MPDIPGLMCTLGDEPAYLSPPVEELPPDEDEKYARLFLKL